MTLIKKNCKKIVSVFIILFPKLPQKCVKVPKKNVNCQKYRLGPPAPAGGLKYDIYKKLGQIMTLTKKLCKKIFSGFIIAFPKLPQKCVKVPKIMTICMHNMQTRPIPSLEIYFPWILEAGISGFPGHLGRARNLHEVVRQTIIMESIYLHDRKYVIYQQEKCF